MIDLRSREKRWFNFHNRLDKRVHVVYQMRIELVLEVEGNLNIYLFLSEKSGSLNCE